MADILPTRTAWENVFTNNRETQVYVRQAVQPGIVKCAALGIFRPSKNISTADMLAFVGTSLVLFSFDDSISAMSHICSTPVFTNVLCIERLRQYDTKISKECFDSANGQYDQCLVLSEGGELITIRVEGINEIVRLRAVERCQVTMRDIDGSRPRLLRKLAMDPLARAVAVVSWLEHIEVILLADEDMQAGVILGSKRRHIATGGAICDAAFLTTLQAEIKRVLMVAAVLDGQRQSISLQLYETWMNTTGCDLDFVAKLPLPFDMTTPLHIVPLPEFAEEFLLITEDEVALVSAFQILSGDIHLYRQKLPRNADCVGRDLARSFCVAGTISFTDVEADNEVQRPKVQTKSPYQKRYAAGATFSKRSHERTVAQKLYISMQSGALIRVCVVPPLRILLIDVVATGETAAEKTHTFAGDILGCLKNAIVNTGSTVIDTTATSSDKLFIGGDCTDSTIVEVQVPLDYLLRDGTLVSGLGEDLAGLDSGLVKQVRTILSSQAPAIDISLQQNQLLMTSGRSEQGAVLSTEFGHAINVYRHTELGIESDRVLGGTAALRGWSIRYPSQMADCGSDSMSCVVLQCAKDNIPIIEDNAGDWQVCQMIYRVISSRRLLFIGNAGREAERLLCVFDDCIDIVDSTGDDTTEDIKVVRLVNAQDGEVFTHGTYVASEDGSCWAVVALCLPPKAGSIDGNIKPRYKAQVRAFPVCDIEGKAPNSNAAPIEVNMEHEITCLRAFVVSGSIIVVVGTFKPTVHIFRIHSGTLSASLVSLSVDPLGTLISNNGKKEQYDSALINGEMGDGMAKYMDAAAVSDVYIVGSSDVCYILVGFRNGRLGWADMTAQLITHSHGNLAAQTNYTPVLVNAGTIPIAFAGMDNSTVPSSLYNIADAVVVNIGSLFIARIGKQGMLEITPCIGGAHNPRQYIRSVIPLADGHVSVRRFFAISGSNELEVIGISNKPQCLVRELPIGCEPRRVVVDRDTGMLLVTTIAAPDSALMLVDPKNGQICASVRLQTTETVGALATWYVEKQRTYRFVCVGTARHTGGGRLVIYTIKTTRRRTGKYELRFVWESERSNGITALASLGDSYLVIAQGTSCVVLRLNVAQGHLVECCELPLRFRATSLHVREFEIVAASERESVHVMRFTPAVDGGCERLELLHTTRFGIPTADAQFLSDDLVAGIGRHGCLFITARPEGSEFAMDAAVAFHIGTECTRLRVGTLVKRLHIPLPVLAWSDSELPTCLVATTVEGAIWTAVRITDCAYELLHRLESAMLGMPPLHPAQPLVLAADGSTNRSCGRSSMQPANAIDGSLAAIFCNSLTDLERTQVVDSSSDLRILALKMCGYEPSTGSIADATAFICRLIRIIDNASIC
ncbi:hypothetical protein COEREDRAFT_6096 [Coemansia reversa NRRL 1564]|uniref:DNA damage-binding protein 1 n=1 Tax=Coemansia reversa (strain ATCC 12441 / NRRL 1564) TaxID=763665 RepID=A0A2G5BIT5_COERN|nr:hypothetical protein COEREDRAFT_6096 [Coemansia reversa NRRL 1564]|eukprot:PIA18928.1 hypothetical protein COEREDRAFT_6096 [Coemansia reversa NRRL 1564]